MGEAKNIYILSTGRSGSTYLSKIFRKKCKGLNIGHQDKGSRLINIISNTPGISEKLYIKIFQYFDRGYPPSPTADPLLSMAILELIKSNNLNAKVVHLIRDPRNFVESFMNWKRGSFRKQVLHHGVPFWNPVPVLEDDNIKLTYWLKMSKFEKFCWIWTYKNKLFRGLKSDMESYLLVRLEDLTSNIEEKRKKEFKKIEYFLDVSFKENGLGEQSKVNPSEKNFFPSYSQWTRDQKRILKKHCGDFAKEVGYHI